MSGERSRSCRRHARMARTSSSARPAARSTASATGRRPRTRRCDRSHLTESRSCRPRQEASLEGGVIAIFLERMAADEPTTIYGDGKQTRDFIYVGDVVRGVLAAIEHAGGVYNIGTGVE